MSARDQWAEIDRLYAKYTARPEHSLIRAASPTRSDPFPRRVGYGWVARDSPFPRPAEPFNAASDPDDVLQDSCTRFYLQLRPTPRAVPLIDKQRSADVVHSSAFARNDRPPITVDAYRPSHVLKKNETVTCAVYTHERWNATGFYLEKGEYSFHAKGQWLGGRIAVGPGGRTGIRFRPSTMFQLVGSSIGWLQNRFRRVTHNPAATFFGAPRVPGAPWRALIGVVAARASTEGRAETVPAVRDRAAMPLPGAPSRLPLRLCQRRLELLLATTGVR